MSREELWRKAEQHDNAAFLAMSDFCGPSDPERAARLWKRRDEYYAMAEALPARPPSSEPTEQ